MQASFFDSVSAITSKSSFLAISKAIHGVVDQSAELHSSISHLILCLVSSVEASQNDNVRTVLEAAGINRVDVSKVREIIQCESVRQALEVEGFVRTVKKNHELWASILWDDQINMDTAKSVLSLRNKDLLDLLTERQAAKAEAAATKADKAKKAKKARDDLKELKAKKAEDDETTRLKKLEADARQKAISEFRTEQLDLLVQEQYDQWMLEKAEMLSHIEALKLERDDLVTQREQLRIEVVALTNELDSRPAVKRPAVKRTA